MPFLRNLLVLAVTSGVAKKAWDRYREKNAGDAGYEGSRDRRASDRSGAAQARAARRGPDRDKPGRD